MVAIGESTQQDSTYEAAASTTQIASSNLPICEGSANSPGCNVADSVIADTEIPSSSSTSCGLYQEHPQLPPPPLEPQAELASHQQQQKNFNIPMSAVVAGSDAQDNYSTQSLTDKCALNTPLVGGGPLNSVPRTTAPSNQLLPQPSTGLEMSSQQQQISSEQLPQAPVARNPLLIYVEHYRAPTPQLLGRPARQQVPAPNEDSTAGYIQGSEEYNIWYGKYLGDRQDIRRGDQPPARARCNPFTDSGWTMCDFQPELDRPVFCLYFARGCCYLGEKCRYYHRVPTAEDNARLDMMHDIFGRERHPTHRSDLDGVGSFEDDCRTLFVSELKVHRAFANVEEKTRELILQQFGVWGPVEDVAVVRNRNFAFVRYRYRASAEFAKVAMAEQKLLFDSPNDQIAVRWARPQAPFHSGHSSSLEKFESDADFEEWEMACAAVLSHMQRSGYTQEDIEGQIRATIEEARKTAL